MAKKKDELQEVKEKLTEVKEKKPTASKKKKTNVKEESKVEEVVEQPQEQQSTASVERYSPDAKYGLTYAQVQERYAQGVVNKNAKHYTKSYWEIFRTNVLTFFNIFLFIIAIALLVFKKYNCLFFMLVQFLNIMIGIVQDIRAKKAIEKMRLVTESKCDVLREGEIMSIKTNEIVLDEACCLSPGKQIVIDGIVLDGFCEVNESLLTGESVAIKKGPGDKVFAGSFVTSGKAVVRADKISDDTFVQQLQKKAKIISKPKSELLNSLNMIFKWISFIIIPMAILMLIGNWLQVAKATTYVNSLGEVIEYTSYTKARDIIGKTAGSLVSMIPAGMFLLTSMTLTVGVINLSSKRAFVQELYSIESLARVDVICLDKTGTLTDGTMNLEDVITFNKHTKKDVKETLGSYLRAVEDDNQTARALMASIPLNEKYLSSQRLPFSSDRKYSAVALKDKGTFYLGAPDFLYKENDEKVLKQIQEYLAKGNRVLMFSHSNKPIDEKHGLPNDLKPVAMFVLSDHIRDDAIDTIKWFQENEVDVKIISGDNPASVSEIARQVGVKYAERYISLEGMSVDQVEAIARDYTVFGRVTPEQKAAIIRSLRRHKYTAAMVGDGVNDILALKEADCSIAMAAGSEAARDAAHIVLLDSNFAVLPDVVAEGRRVINNLQNVSSLFLVKTVFSMLFSLIWMAIMFTTLGLGTSATPYPFETYHMYIWEIIAIGFGAFFIALQPNKRKISGSFAANVIRRAVPAGVLIAMMVFLVFIFGTTHRFGMDGVEYPETFVACGCVIMYVMAYVVLFRMCLPLNWYRGVLFAILSLLAVAVLLVNEYVDSFDLLHFKLSMLSHDTWSALIGIIISGIVLYAGMNIAIHFWEIHNEKKQKEILKMLHERNEMK